MDLKETLRHMPGVHAVLRSRDNRTLRGRVPGEDPRSRARERWQRSAPDAGLTWGKQLSGDAFVRAAAEHGAFGPERRVLEIGPGYGRLARAAATLELPFASWTGVDLSSETVRSFNEAPPHPAARAVEGNADTVALGETFHTMLSSLTLKHVYPTCELALANVARHMEPGGVAVFDLIEGQRRFFERGDGVTYIRHYTRDELSEMVPRAGLRIETFGHVDHDDDPAHRRLLVVAVRPA